MTDSADGFDSTTYGRSFADIYDSWYPSDEDTDRAVTHIRSLAGSDARIMDLGIGTGRMAIPLANLGYCVRGIDSSQLMLDRLRAKCRQNNITIDAVHGDVTDPVAWGEVNFDVILATYNFLFNMTGDEAKLLVLANAADHLTSDGILVAESYVPGLPATSGDSDADPTPQRNLEVKSVTVDSIVMIATETDPNNGMVIGQHIELRDGMPVRLRPWKVHMISPDHLDTLASQAGLRRVARYGDWQKGNFGPDSTRVVTHYVREARS